MVRCMYTNFLFLIILNIKLLINILHQQEQKKLAHEPPVYGRHHLSKIQTHYSSFMEYSNVFRPLLLLEIWNSLSRESECDEKKSK